MVNWWISDIEVGIAIAVALVFLGLKNFFIKLFINFIILVVSCIE